MRTNGYIQFATIMAILLFAVSLGAMLMLGYDEVERIMASSLFQIIFTILSIVFFALLWLGHRTEK